MSKLRRNVEPADLESRGVSGGLASRGVDATDDDTVIEEEGLLVVIGFLLS